MGYTTYFQFSTVPEEARDRIIGHITREREAMDDEYFCWGINGDDEDEAKWYDHDEDMLQISRLFPEVVLILDGEGESIGDIWRSFYKNGRIHTWRPELSPPSFNPKWLD